MKRHRFIQRLLSNMVISIMCLGMFFGCAQLNGIHKDNHDSDSVVHSDREILIGSEAERAKHPRKKKHRCELSWE